MVGVTLTENKAVINGETVQIIMKYVLSYVSRDLIYQKIDPLRDVSFGADCLTPFRILKIITVGLKYGFC